MAKLNLGSDLPTPDKQEKERRIAELEATTKEHLPNFAKAVAETTGDRDDEVIILHQDAFAGGYDHDEYTLLGMAVKYAGLKGVSLNIYGTNGESINGPTDSKKPSLH